MSKPKKAELMRLMFGADEKGRRCQDCTNLINVRRNDYYHKKCTVYGDSRSEATDWAGSWDACGMCGKEYGGVPVLEMKEKPQPILEGQTELCL